MNTRRWGFGAKVPFPIFRNIGSGLDEPRLPRRVWLCCAPVGTGGNIGRGGRRGRNVGERGATVPDFVPFQLPPRQTGACGVTGNGRRLAHTCPTLRPGAARRLVLPCRGSGARGAPVRARSICEALGGFWGYPTGQGWGNSGKDGYIYKTALAWARRGNWRVLQGIR